MSYVIPTRSVRLDARLELLPDAGILKEYYEGASLAEKCRAGCRNYSRKWSCPPFAPAFPDVLSSSGCGRAILLAMSAPLDNYADVAAGHLAVKAANSTLKSVIERCARALEEKTEGYALLTGSCRLCRPCAGASGAPCRHPEQMRFSGEATGLNLERVCSDLLDLALQWNSRDKRPSYTSAVSVILARETDPSFDWEELIAARVPRATLLPRRGTP